MVSPPSTFPISHDHLSCLPKPLPLGFRSEAIRPPKDNKYT